ncbi:hypothetical protein DIPPA_08669 [Diplonema papillatum]|nr:hypothetical protein DIPPA_08669 [Diplonema papillatum]
MSASKCLSAAALPLLLLLLLPAGAAGCRTAVDCGTGFFCRSERCVQCGTSDQCPLECSCNSASCSCPSSASVNPLNLVSPPGAACGTNAACAGEEYCYTAHCLFGTLPGCTSNPTQGRCAAVPTLPDEDDDDGGSGSTALLVGFIIVLILLICLICVFCYVWFASGKGAAGGQQPAGGGGGGGEDEDGGEYPERQSENPLKGYEQPKSYRQPRPATKGRRAVVGDDDDDEDDAADERRRASNSSSGRAAGSRDWTAADATVGSPSLRHAKPAPSNNPPSYKFPPPSGKGTLNGGVGWDYVASPVHPPTDKRWSDDGAGGQKEKEKEKKRKKGRARKKPAASSAVSVSSASSSSSSSDEGKDRETEEIVAWVLATPGRPAGLTCKRDKVSRVDPNGPAANGGIQPGMRVVSVSGTPVANKATKDVHEEFDRATRGPQPFVVCLVAPVAYAPGDRVEVRNRGQKDWQQGVVVEAPRTANGRPAVLPDGMPKPAAFDFCRKAKNYPMMPHRTSERDLPPVDPYAFPRSPERVRSTPSERTNGQSSTHFPSQTLPTLPYHMRDDAIATPVKPGGARSHFLDGRSSSSSPSSSSRPAPRDAPPQTHTPGTQVGASFNGTWYPARLFSVEQSDEAGTLYTVDWGDGTMTSGLYPSEVTAYYAPGSAVQAVFRGVWYQAIVKAFTADGTYSVQWADQSITHNVVPLDVRSSSKKSAKKK